LVLLEAANFLPNGDRLSSADDLEVRGLVRNQYAVLEAQVPDSNDFHLVRTTLKISEAFFPLSPLRISALIKNSSSGRGDSAIISYANYYDTILNRLDDILESCLSELDAHLEAYRKYLARRAMTSSIIVGLKTLRAAMIFAILLFFLTYSFLGQYAGISRQEKLRVEAAFSSVLTIKWSVIALSAIVAAYIAIYGSTRLLNGLERSLQATAVPLSDRLLHEFRSVLVGLLRARVERRHDSFLRTDRAPTLVEIDSANVIPSKNFDDVYDFLTLHLTSAIGIAGPRGVGKSTLLRWVTSTLQPEWIAIYLAAPGSSNPVDVVRVIFRATVNAVIASYQTSNRSSRFNLTGGLLGSRRPRPTAEEIVRISYEALSMISMSRSNQRTAASGISGKGISYLRGQQTSWVERERSHPEWIAAFVGYLDSYRRLGGRRIAIAIDELDKLPTADDLIAVINSLKDLFHRPDTHFLVSVSEDALRRFALRGIPVRDTFDSAFDTIVKIEPPSPEDAWKILARRAGDFPMSTALFCYAWSGGLIRETIRLARSCVNIRRAKERPTRTAEAVAPIVRQDIIDAIDSAVASFLDQGRRSIVESLLKLRRELDDKMVEFTELRTSEYFEAEPAIEDSEGNETLKNLAAYVDVGSLVSEYFGADIDMLLERDSDKVFRITVYLARARAALSLHHAEALWLLSCARNEMYQASI
jgi:hypothetical protein